MLPGLMTYHWQVVIWQRTSAYDRRWPKAASQFGFEGFRFQPDEKRSKYYVPGTQIEVYAYHPGLIGSGTKYESGWVEIATFGVYSPTALAQYDIPYPVMNLGLGVERLAMILNNSRDLRALSYPQLQPRVPFALEMAR